MRGQKVLPIMSHVQIHYLLWIKFLTKMYNIVLFLSGRFVRVGEISIFSMRKNVITGSFLMEDRGDYFGRVGK
jgi:hypothetical protein